MAPPLVTRLPKVTEYVRNVGKSVQFAAVDYLKDTMPDTHDFIETNQELFKDIASAVKDYKGTLKAADKSIRRSKIYEAGSELKKTLFDSIRTGKFYDPERENYYRDKAGGSLGDMSDMDDWGFDTNQFDIDDGSGDISTNDSTSILSSTVKDATTAQASVIAKSSEYLAEMNKANTKLLFAQGEKLYSAVSGGLAGTQAMLDKVNQFLYGPLTAHIENSKTFFESALPAIEQINKSVQEIAEMQRNLYKREQEKDKESQYSLVGGSSPDLREYAKQVKKNFMEFLGPEAQMLFGNDMGDGNMLMSLVANPLAAIPNYVVKTIIPATVKKSLETIDATFSNLFANIIARLNHAAKDDFSNPILNFLGRIFGLRVDKKSTYDTSKYEKGPVPFDGITRKSIVEIIPGHLARIEAALTGRGERVFDYETGKWTTAKKVKEKHDYDRRRNVEDAFWETGGEVRENISRYRRSKDENSRKRADELEQAYRILMNKIYEDEGDFRPYDKHRFGDTKVNPWVYYGLDRDTYMQLAHWLVGTKDNPKSTAYKIGPNVLRAKESLAKDLREQERRGYSNQRYLYNNSYDFSTDKERGTGISNILTEAKDKYQKNIFWYLRGIYAEISTIRQSGGFGGSSSRGGGPLGPSPDPRLVVENRLQKEIDEAEYKRRQEEAAKNVGTTNEDYLDIEQDIENKDTVKYAKKIREKGKSFLNELLEANSIGAKFKVIQSNIRALTEAPANILSGIIGSADRQVFKLLFGGQDPDKFKDDEGRTAKGLLDYMILNVKRTFDNINEKIDAGLEALKKKLGIESFSELFKRLADRLGLTKAAGFVKDKVKQWSQPTIDRIKEKMGWGWNQFKGSMGRTYGATWNKVKANFAQSGPAPRTRGRANTAVTPDVIEMGGNVGAPLALPSHIEEMAYGGLVTRRGLAVISPGEKVVPVGGRVTQRNNLVAEKAFARRLGLPSGLSFYATGNTSGVSDEELENAKRVVKNVTNEVLGDTKHKGIANVIASSLLGGGFSLLTGLIGGPLLGAAAGAAFGITQNSGTVQNLLFGDEIVDKDGNPTGERKGGLISADLQKKFKKYFPSMRDFGLAGAVAGLFTPFGLIGGLMAGSAIGFAKENEGFQEWLLGKKDKETGERDGGLISKEFRDRVKKAAPRMLIGAAGAALLGPFGLIGNAALGSAMGLVTTTDTFHKAVFGEDDGNGKKKGGIVPAIYRGIVKPLYATGKKFIEGANDFFKNHIKKNVEIFFPALIQMVKNGIVGIGDHVKDFLDKMFEKTIGRPLADFLEHSIFDRVRKVMGGLLKAPLALAKGVIGAPFAAMGFIGNNIRSSQIAKGTAGDMTAAQRLQWRDQHRLRMFGRELTGHDKFRNLDEKMANTSVEQMKEMRTQMNLYLSTRKELGKQAAEVVTEAGQVVSEFFNYTMCEDDDTRTLYQAVGAGRVKKIHENIKKGKIEPIQRDLNWMVREGYLDPSKIPDFIAKLTPYITRIQDLIEKQKDSKKVQNDAMSKLSRWSGGTLRGVKNIRRYSRLLNKEIDAREAEEAKAKATQEAEDAKPENVIKDTINKGTEQLIKKTDTITGILRIMNANLMMLNGSNPEAVKEAMGGESNPELKKIHDAVMKAKGLDPNTPQLGSNQQLLALPAPGQTVGGTRATDDVITGDRKAAVNAVNHGYHTVETEEGYQGLKDSNGRLLPTSSAGAIRRSEAQRERENEYKKTFREKLNDSLFGKAAKAATGLIGGVKDGLFGLLGSALSKFEPAFNVLKWVFLGTTAVAAIGHGTGWLEEKVFPFIRDKVGPWLIGTPNDDGVLIGGIRGLIFGNKTGEGGRYEDGLLSGIANKIAESPVGVFFSDVNERIKSKGGLINWIKTDLLDNIFEWYVSGIDKFIDRLFVPLVEKLVSIAPEVLFKLGVAIGKGILSWLPGFGDKDDDKGENTDYTYTDHSSGTSKLSGATEGSYKTTTSNTGVTFFTDNNGNPIWRDNVTGAYAVRDSSGMYYDMTTGAPIANNGQFTLAKSNEYSTGNGGFSVNPVAGIANNFLVTATGMRGTANVAKTFKAGGIFKNVRKSLKLWNPIGAAVNAASAGVKTGYNAAAVAGNKASSLGAQFRQYVNSALGHTVNGRKPSTQEAYNMVQNLLNSQQNPVLALPAPGETAAEAATNATAKGGILSRIKSSAANFVGGIKDKIANTSIGKKASSVIDTVKSGIGKLTTGIKDKASSLIDTVKSKVGSTSVAQKVASTADDAAGFLSKIKNGILKFFNGIAENKAVTKLISGVAKIFGTTIDDALIAAGFKEAGELFVKKIGENAAKSTLKSLANTLVTIPIFTIVLAIGYFTSGWNDAHSIFGIAKEVDIPIVYNVIAGLVNAVKNCLPGIGVILAFIDTDTIINIFTDTILPKFGWDDSNLQKLRQESQKYIDEWNAEADEEDKVTNAADYNDKAHPGILTKIGNTVKSIGSTISGWFSGGKKTESGSNRLREIDQKISNSGKRRLRGFGHLYQGDPRLENVKFGNSTLGKAGCAPVAAANMMNGNLAYATKMAERYQTSDGGVTPDYFTNTLGGYQTDSKKSMLRAIKNGQQTVLLGNSGREQGTPFGANDHYITAKGMDRRGNIIVEDPDLPGGSYRYPASRVMRDTTTGVITGMRRGQSRRRGMRRRYGFERTGGDVQAQQVSKLAVKGYNITRQFEGNYGSINKNDNGALSIGRIQWHGVRAFDLVQEIISAVGASTSMSLLGNKIYSEVVNGTRNDWKHRTVNDSEAKQISALISTDIGKKIQDNRACIDYDGYLKAGKNKGLTDENALCYYGDLCNQGGSGGANRVLTAAISMAGGSASMVTLDIIHKAALADSVFAKYSARREKCYNALKNSTLVGTTGLTTTDAIPLADDATGATYFSSATTTGDTAGLAETVVGAVFGQDVLNLLKGIQSGFSTDSTTTTTTGGTVTGTYTGHNVTLPNSGALPTVGTATPEGVVAQMKSITENGIKYSLNGGEQNPDVVQSDGNRYASCASTVAWAYDRAVGYKPGGANYARSTLQSKDSNFTTIYTNKGNGLVDTNILQPGDIMYYNWDRTSNNGTMQHTELYAGNGQDISHGGPNHGDSGPLYKTLDNDRKKNLMMVRRYNGFMNASQSGSSRRRGYARAMTSGVSASISDNAKRVISQYGISTSGQTPNYRQGDFSSYSEGAAYNQFLAVIIDLLAAIADNTKGLAEFQNALNNRGISVDSSTLEKAAANARKRAARARNRQLGGYKPNITSATTFTPSDASDLMNSPTGFMVQAMEALATE